tara:strand:- start:164 stop:541 length:378 start_codon:yes stop_codon:yes gene_type:complete
MTYVTNSNVVTNQFQTPVTAIETQKQISRSFNDFLFRIGGVEEVDAVNRRTFNSLVGVSPSNYRMQTPKQDGTFYSSGKEALRVANPEIAKAKAVQELLMLQGLSEKDATKQAVRIYGGQKQVRI